MTDAFQQLLALYRDAFPVEERKSSETLKQMLARTDYRVWVSQRDRQVVAFAIVHVSSTRRIALLEYMAVHPGLRGRGIGRHLLQHILPVLREARRPVLIEVDSDQLAAPDQVLRHRRKQFYRSIGAQDVIGLHYRMPQVSTGTPPPMDLLLCPAEPLASGRQHTIAKRILHAWLTTLYVEVYSQSPTDPRLTTMLAGLPDEITLL